MRLGWRRVRRHDRGGASAHGGATAGVSAQPRMSRRRPRLTLRALEPREGEVQAGVIRLCGMHPAVPLAVRVNAGCGVILRPPPGPDGFRRLNAQLDAAIAAGHLMREQVGWVQNAPPGTPDILGMMASGHALGLEVKSPLGRATPAQGSTIQNIIDHGGLGAIVKSVDEVDRLFNNWRKSHATAN